MRLASIFVSLATAGAAKPLVEHASSCPASSHAALAAAKSAFISTSIVPDLIPSFAPTVQVSADFSGKQVELGNVFGATGR